MVGGMSGSSKKLNEHGSSSRLDSLEWDDVIHREIKQSELELDDDYCEMVIQVRFLSFSTSVDLHLLCVLLLFVNPASNL